MDLAMAKNISSIKSLDKGIKLIEYIANYGEGVTIAELNKKFGFGKSTIHRLLSTFKAAEFVRQSSENSRYMLGFKIFELNHRFEGNNLLLKIGKKYLKELCQITEETANIGVLDGKSVIYLAKEESLQQLRTTAPVGGRLPAHCTALGKALLSSITNEQVQEQYPDIHHFIKSTEKSISDFRQLKKELDRIRTEGIAHDNEEAALGIRCLAVPIKNYTGRTIAAMSLSIPTQRATPPLILKYSELLKKKGKAFSRELGHRWEEE